MKAFRHIVSIVFAAMLIGCNAIPDQPHTVRHCASLPDGGRACATCFVVNGKGYLFGGRDADQECRNDLWCYDPESDSWTDLGETPLHPRVNATACVHDGKVYMGLGFNGKYGNDTSYLRDYWQLDPKTMTWTQLSSYPNTYTDCATSFAGDGELLVGYGFCWRYRRDMFRYDIATDHWDSIDVHVSGMGYPIRSFGGTGCTCGGRHLMGTGYYRVSLNWWAELLPEGRWVKRAEVPGRTRTLAASAATDRYIYLCGGVHYGGVNTCGEVLQDLLRYDPEADSWVRVAVLPSPMMNHVCFTIGRTVYFGMGEDADVKLISDLYCIEE